MPDNNASEELTKIESDELTEIKARMAEIKEITTEELIRDWPSPWRNDAMTNAKVTGRLGGNKEYQTLLQRSRALQDDQSVSDKPRDVDEYEESEDPMGSYAIKIAKDQKEQRESEDANK